MRLIEDERCEEAEDHISVSASEIAMLTKGELAALGLPPPAPHELDVTSEGNITDDGFRFAFRWFRNGEPVRGVINRRGCIISSGGEQFTLLDPLYSIVDTMECFNASPPTTREDRFLVWGSLRQHLPSDSISDGYLREMRVARADAFTLTNSQAKDGTFMFDPVPVRSKTGHSVEGEYFDDDGEDMPAALPLKQQERFVTQFRNSSNVRSSYALPGQYYVVIPERVRTALAVARAIQNESEEERRAFFLSPRSVLKERLGDALDEETIEGIFYESAEYSNRVRGITAWVKPVIPFYKTASEPWLPPELLGVEVDGQRVDVRPCELIDLAKAVQEAIVRGEPAADFNGQEVKATPEILEAIEALIVAYPDQHSGSKDLAEGKSKHSEADDGPILTLAVGRNIDEIDFTSTAQAEKPSVSFEVDGLHSALLAHQQKGLRWLQDCLVTGSPGALLADDMGLGKTFQVLAFLRWLKALWKRNGTDRPILVVGPTGLLTNWEQEHDRHLDSPGLGNVLRAYGSGLQEIRTGSQGHELHAGTPKLNHNRLSTASWALTTYETMRDYQHSFAMVPWGCVVFDEVQKIKNPTALMTDAAKALNSSFTIGMTGTPVENRVEDLWCIIDALHPSKLGSLKEFSKRYGTADIDGLTELKQTIEGSSPALMLRRLKRDHLKGLPECHEHVIDQDMPPVQAEAYRLSVQQARHSSRGEMLKAIQAFRSISLHPKLRSSETDEVYIDGSARLIVCFKILDQVYKRREKCLIFLESLEMHGILCEVIQRRYRMLKRPMIISGKVSGMKRQERVDQFQQDSNFDVLILSPRAGGLGLTLTAANNVIHLSRWWNPAIEDQCSDRVYRIGQNRPVNIYIPRAIHPEYKKHSFDLRLHDLLERKRHLSRTLLAPPSASSDDIEALFKGVTGSV